MFMYFYRKIFLLAVLCASVISARQVSAQCVGLPSVSSLGSNKFPVGLCAPVRANVTYNVSFTAPVPAGVFELVYNWGDGSASEVIPLTTGDRTYSASRDHDFPQESDCEYFVEITIRYNGQVCTTTRQIQKIASWRTDAFNGGEVKLVSPVTGSPEHLVCEGDDIDVVFSDETDWSCNAAYTAQPPTPIESPNTEYRWQQILYNTSASSSKIPNVQVNGVQVTGANGADIMTNYQDSRGVLYMGAPVVLNDPRRRPSLRITAPGGFGSGFPKGGDVFEVTVRYWNFCNPYDDPAIPGPPADPVNGDNAPVAKTAIIRIKAAPSAPSAVTQEVCNGVTPSAFAVTGVEAKSIVKWYRYVEGADEAGPLITSGSSLSLPITSHPDWENNKTPGVYRVWASQQSNVAGALSCESPKVLVTRMIRENIPVPDPVVALPEDVCNSTSITVTLPAPATELVGGSTQYTWTGSSGVTVASSTASSAIFNINVTSFGSALFVERTITVNRRFTDAPACSKSRVFKFRVQRPAIGGTLSVTSDVCETAPVGIITLFGHTGEVTGWEVKKDNGAFAAYTGPAEDETISPGILSPGTYTFRALVKNSVCDVVYSRERQVVVFDNPAAAASAGPDQFVCTSLSSEPFTASNPSPGMGVWSYVSSVPAGLPEPVFSTNKNDPNTRVSIASENAGAYTLRWTVSNGECTSYDDVVIDFGTDPTVPDAGNDRSVCGPTVTLEGNVPAKGLGSWSVVAGPNDCSGSGCEISVANPSAPESTATLNGPYIYGDYVLRWTISSGGNNCFLKYDDVTITFLEPTQIAASDISTICLDPNNLAPIALAGTLTGGTGAGEWVNVSGQGKVSASLTSGTEPRTVTASYTPVYNDYVTGTPVSVKLVSRPEAGSVCTVTEKVITITFDRKPVAKAGVNLSTICSDTVVLSAQNPPPFGATGQWTTTQPGVTFDDLRNPETVVRNLPLPPNNTIITWTLTSASGKCVSEPSSVTLTRTTPPSAFDLQLTECEAPPSGGPVTAAVLLTDYENTVTFLPAASREITWYKDSRVVNPSQTNVITGQVYTANIRDTGTGCSSDARVTFTVRPLPKVTDAVASLCEDVPGSGFAAGIDLNQNHYRSMVTAESNVDITWYRTESDARSALSPVTAPLNISGTSQVYARVAYNSELPRCYDIATLSLIVNSRPSNTEIFGREAVCQGDPDRLSIEIYQVVPVNGARYYWEIPTENNEFKVYGGGKETDFFVLLQFPNIYEGKIKVRVELNGCSGPTLEKAVSVTPSSVAPVINGDTLVCESSHNVTFSVSPNNFPSSSYQWEVRKASDNSTGGAYIVNGQSTGTILVDFLEEDVILSVRESNAVCVSPAATQMIRITQNPEVSAMLHKAVTFFQGADGAIRAEVAGGHPPYHEYKLLPDNIVDLDHDGIFHNLDAGSYSIQVTDSEGCADTSEPFILEQGAPVTGPDADAVFKATPAAACAPVSIEIQNESEGADIYSWKVYRGGVLVMESALKDPVFRIVDAGTYDIQLMVRSSSTGQKDSASMNGIEVYPVPLASFRVSSTPVYAPDTELQPLNDSEGANQYQWNFGDGFTTSEFEPAHAYSQAGNYTIELIASHDHGSKDLDGDGVPDNNVVCYDTARHGVVALDGGVIEIPNAFTPSLQGPSGGVDQGGINDVFIPRTKDVIDYSMQIFNRWGTLIFESRDVNIGWDGYDQDGKLMPAGVYIYKFVLGLPDGQRTTRVGDVSLLR